MDLTLSETEEICRLWDITENLMSFEIFLKI